MVDLYIFEVGINKETDHLSHVLVNMRQTQRTEIMVERVVHEIIINTEKISLSRRYWRFRPRAKIKTVFDYL